MFVHQLQQQRPHDVRVVLQLSVQRHRQQGGEITASTGVKVRTALQRADELEAEILDALEKTWSSSSFFEHLSSISTTNPESWFKLRRLRPLTGSKQISVSALIRRN